MHLKYAGGWDDPEQELKGQVPMLKKFSSKLINITLQYIVITESSCHNQF